MASRHLARSIVLQSLYEWDFNGGPAAPDQNITHLRTVLERNIGEFGPGLEDKPFTVLLMEGVLAHRKEIDAVIEEAAPEWPIAQVAIVDRNILRMGLFELLYGNHAQVPPKVAINEAIELAKTFGGTSSSKFVNGVLGTVYREMGEPGKDDKPRKDLSPEEIAALPMEEKVGAVVYRKDTAGAEFAMVHDVFGYWTLAKGTPAHTDDLAQSVIEKVREETGLQHIVVKSILGENEYVAHDPERGKIRRRVTYFLLETPDTDLVLKTSGGLDDVRWFGASELEGLATYDDVRGFLKKALEITNT